MSLKQRYQAVGRLFFQAHNHAPSSSREIAQWGLDEGLLKTRPVDPVARLANEISEALSDEKGAGGYRMNLARRAERNGQSTMLWGRVDDQPREFVEAAVQDWRKQIAGECVVVAKTLQHRQEVHPEEEPIQFVFDFSDDVAEELQDPPTFDAPH